MDAVGDEVRLRSLLTTGIALSSELSLEGLLQRIVEAAAELTGARYAALGVIDRTGSQLERFLTHGIDAETHATIGDLPRGRGILGVLIREAAPLRLHDLAEDPRSVGFPPGHPPMRSFLGVPILLRGVAYGNLYLTEKEGEADFTAEDEDLVTLLSSQAAVAIENARLYEAATRWSRQLESLNEIGNAVATETDLDRLLDLVVQRLRDLLDCRLITLMLPNGREELRFAAAAGEGSEGLVDQTLPLRGSKSGRVLERRHSERVDSVLDDPEANQEVLRRAGVRSGLWVPLVVRDRTIGVLAAHDKRGVADARFTDDDLRLAESFGQRAAIAVDLSERFTRAALQRMVSAQELERKRLSRELHDETGQALTSILLGLKGLEDTLDSDASRAAAAGLRELVVNTLQDVRRLAVELRPAALDDFGLASALERLTQTIGEQTGIAIDFASTLGDERLAAEIETTLYRVAQESLTNVVKHARARRVSLVLQRRDRVASLVIEDDGAGFDPDALDDHGLGLVGMRERLALAGGRLTVESSEGRGATLAAEVPLS